MINYKDCDTTGVSLIHQCDGCQDIELGRIRTLFLIKPGTQITIPLDLEEWTAAIEAGNIIAIPNVKGSSDGGSALTADGYGDKSERLLAWEYTLNVADPSYKLNSEFYQTAEKQTWNVAYCTDTLLHYTDQEVTLKATDPIEDGTDSEVVWSLELKFRTKDKPVKTPKAPIASLLRCFEVTEDGM